MKAPAVIVHNLGHARAAVKAAGALGVPVVLISAPMAAAYAGAAYFLEITARAMGEYPDASAVTVLDCGSDAGLALGALRVGCKAVRFTGPGVVRKKIADIAAQMGAQVDNRAYRALDLLAAADAYGACLAWLKERH